MARYVIATGDDGTHHEQYMPDSWADGAVDRHRAAGRRAVVLDDAERERMRDIARQIARKGRR